MMLSGMTQFERTRKFIVVVPVVKRTRKGYTQEATLNHGKAEEGEQDQINHNNQHQQHKSIP